MILSAWITTHKSQSNKAFEFVLGSVRCVCGASMDDGVCCTEEDFKLNGLGIHCVQQGICKESKATQPIINHSITCGRPSQSEEKTRTRCLCEGVYNLYIYIKVNE
jgi:hypothetical protein